MTYDFDKVYDRRGTLSLKYDGCQRIFGSSDVIPLWVADMDFPTAQPIIDAVQRRAAEGIKTGDEQSFFHNHSSKSRPSSCKSVKAGAV